jgi:hypothetical protein
LRRWRLSGIIVHSEDDADIERTTNIASAKLLQ